MTNRVQKNYIQTLQKKAVKVASVIKLWPKRLLVGDVEIQLRVERS